MQKMVNGEVVEMTAEEAAATEAQWATSAGQESLLPPAVPSLYAAALLVIDGEGGAIGGIGIASKFSAAMWVDVGLYYVFFAETQPDLNYMVKAYDDAASRVRITERTADYIVVTVADASETPIDPPTLSIEITRVN